MHVRSPRWTKSKPLTIFLTFYFTQIRELFSPQCRKWKRTRLRERLCMVVGDLAASTCGQRVLTHWLTFARIFCRILSLLKYWPFKIMASSRSFFPSDPSIISLFFSFQVMVGWVAMSALRTRLWIRDLRSQLAQWRGGEGHRPTGAAVFCLFVYPFSFHFSLSVSHVLQSSSQHLPLAINRSHFFFRFFLPDPLRLEKSYLSNILFFQGRWQHPYSEKHPIQVIAQRTTEEQQHQQRRKWRVLWH